MLEEDIDEMYCLLLKQSSGSSSFNMNKKMKQTSIDEKIIELKSYLNLSNQIGSLKQYKYDIEFSEQLNLNTLQDIQSKFTKDTGLNTNELVYLKNTCFQKLVNLLTECIANFFVIHQRMLYHQNRSNNFETSN